MITLIDTQTGNLQSVRNAFSRVGAETRIAEGAADLETADAIVLPGVGAFERGMDALSGGGFVDTLRRCVLEDRTPFLGICLGMQLLADTGEEHGEHPGLGFVPGRAVALEPTEPGFRVPNIGWYPVAAAGASLLMVSHDERLADRFDRVARIEDIAAVTRAAAA